MLTYIGTCLFWLVGQNAMVRSLMLSNKWKFRPVPGGFRKVDESYEKIFSCQEYYNTQKISSIREEQLSGRCAIQKWDGD